MKTWDPFPAWLISSPVTLGKPPLFQLHLLQLQNEEFGLPPKYKVSISLYLIDWDTMVACWSVGAFEAGIPCIPIVCLQPNCVQSVGRGKHRRGGWERSVCEVTQFPTRMLHFEVKIKTNGGKVYFKVNDHYQCFIFTIYLGQDLEEWFGNICGNIRVKEVQLEPASLEEVSAYVGLQRRK